MFIKNGFNHGVWRPIKPCWVIADGANLVTETTMLFAKLTCDSLVRLQANRDDNARPNIGTAPALVATPKVLINFELFRDR